MSVLATEFDGLLVLETRAFSDARGNFTETWRQDWLSDTRFVQDNLARSLKRGTVRGLHFQNPPYAQAKLVSCLKGAIFDVALDLRPQGATFGKVFTIELSEANGKQLFIPEGFAHGYCTLCDDTWVAYKVNAPYAPDHEGGIMPFDDALNIDWPVGQDAAILSPKDMAQMTFSGYSNLLR